MNIWHFIEVLGFVFGIVGVWLTLKENILCFPIGIVNVIASFFLFFDQKLYSDVIQQVVYLILLTYGWYTWKKKIGKPDIGISNSSFQFLSVHLMAAAILSLIMGGLFSRFTDASVPYIDSAATALSFLAQYLIARKRIENWLLWMVVNVTYISIYFYKGLYLYSILFLIYLALAVLGYKQWKSKLSTEAHH